MESITIHIEAPPAIAAKLLRGAAAGLLENDLPPLTGESARGGLGHAASEGVGFQSESSSYQGEVGRENLVRFYRQLQPNARRVMFAIAEAGGSTTATELRARFGGINQSQLAGWLSSVGFTMKKLDLL